MLAIGGAALLWLSQPPLAYWPLAWVALVPWTLLALRAQPARRDYLWLYLASLVHWAVTMQGLRHAHPLMFIPWLLLSAYLAVYPLLWMRLMRLAAVGSSVASRPGLPTWLAVPVFWVGLECVRNYLLTGTSAAMLGHSQADLPKVIQIADFSGTYGVSFLLALCGGALAVYWGGSALVGWRRYPDITAARRQGVFAAILSSRRGGLLVAAAALGATLGYGSWRLRQVEGAADQDGRLQLALIGRDEPIAFEQSPQREWEIFDAYARGSLEAAAAAAERGITLDAVVWPESMFTGGLPYLALDPQLPLAIPPGGDDPQEFVEAVQQSQRRFASRGAQLQSMLGRQTGQEAGPDLIVGSAILRYNEPPGGHSGCVHLDASGSVSDYFAKTHLVMFGEYIPLIEYLPWIERVVPAGMGVLPGDGPVAFRIGQAIVSPNVCIETAVERVTVNHLRQLKAAATPAQWVVNVTNDGWFNRTSVVDHHLRCSQLVAVACRRPLLMAANGGPTVWIDSSGRVVRRLPYHQHGHILVDGPSDSRNSPLMAIGDWPARLLALYGLWVALQALRRRSSPAEPQMGA